MPVCVMTTPSLPWSEILSRHPNGRGGYQTHLPGHQSFVILLSAGEDESFATDMEAILEGLVGLAVQTSDNQLHFCGRDLGGGSQLSCAPVRPSLRLGGVARSLRTLRDAGSLVIPSVPGRPHTKVASDKNE